MGLLDAFRKKEDKKRLASLGRKKNAPDQASSVKPAVKNAAKSPVQKKEGQDKDANTTVASPRSMPSMAHKVLLQPHVTEKTTAAQSRNEFSFLVHPHANKVMIAQAVKEAYGVRPLKIRIVHRRGKRVRYGRIAGQRPDGKKALVQLKDGETIHYTEKAS